MCIICNLPNYATEGDVFLHTFNMSRQAMLAATEAMLAVSKAANRPEHQRRYDGIHKQMVRLRSEWNALEQKREHAAAANAPDSND